MYDNHIDSINWTATEFEEKDRSNDWFWALGIIVVVSVVISVLVKNYFFAILLLIGGIMLGYFAKRKPELFQYELNNDGLKVRSRIYLFKNMKGFWIQTGEKPKLFLHTNRIIMPMFEVPIENHQADEIKDAMLKKDIAPIEMKEHPYQKVMEYFGF